MVTAAVDLQMRSPEDQPVHPAPGLRSIHLSAASRFHRERRQKKFPGPSSLSGREWARSVPPPSSWRPWPTAVPRRVLQSTHPTRRNRSELRAFQARSGRRFCRSWSLPSAALVRRGASVNHRIFLWGKGHSVEITVDTQEVHVGIPDGDSAKRRPEDEQLAGKLSPDVQRRSPADQSRIRVGDAACGGKLIEDQDRIFTEVNSRGIFELDFGAALAGRQAEAVLEWNACSGLSPSLRRWRAPLPCRGRCARRPGQS